MKAERLSCALVAVCGVTSCVWAGPVFRGSVPDFYQHQRWGDATDGDAMQKASWQFESGKFGGWCYHVGMVNALGARYAKDKTGKYKDLLPAGFDGAGWLAKANDEIETFRTSYAAGTSIDKYMKDRIGAPDYTNRKGLVYIESVMGRVGASDAMVYKSSTGAVFRAPYNTDRQFDAAVKELDRGHEVNLIVRTRFGETYPGSLWWQGDQPGSFHTLTMTGYDKTDAANPRVWFADPDVNKGNNDADAIFDSAKRKPDAAFKAKRYAGTDPYPVPATPGADRQEYNWYRVNPTDGRTMLSTASGDNRFNNVRIHDLAMIQTAQAYNKAPPGPATLNSWAITSGDVTPVDQFWVFPNADLDLSITMPTFSVAGTPWDIDVADLLEADLDEADPWGNVREHGGFLVKMPSGSSPLTPSPGSFGDLDFFTTMAMTGLDLFFRDAGTDEWTFQVYGKTYDIRPDQVPGPGVLSLLGLALSAGGRRRARAG